MNLPVQDAVVKGAIQGLRNGYQARIVVDGKIVPAAIETLRPPGQDVPDEGGNTSASGRIRVSVSPLDFSAPPPENSQFRYNGQVYTWLTIIGRPIRGQVVAWDGEAYRTPDSPPAPGENGLNDQQIAQWARP